MIYVERDSEGKITAIHVTPADNATEKKSLDDPEVMAFLEDDKKPGTTLDLLTLSDLEIIRIIDDLVDLLVSKNVIKFTDLPADAQKKLLNRKQARSDLSKKTIIMDEDGIL